MNKQIFAKLTIALFLLLSNHVVFASELQGCWMTTARFAIGANGDKKELSPGDCLRLYTSDKTHVKCTAADGQIKVTHSLLQVENPNAKVGAYSVQILDPGSNQQLRKITYSISGDWLQTSADAAGPRIQSKLSRVDMEACKGMAGDTNASQQAQTTTRTLTITNSECNDRQCTVVTVGLEGKAVTVTGLFHCDAQDMRPNSKVPVCLELFGTNRNEKKAEGRTANLVLKKTEPNSDKYWQIVGGNLLPATANGKESGSTQNDSGWNKFLEKTGNREAPAPTVGAVSVTGSSKFSVNDVKTSCRGQMESTNFNSFVKRGIRADGVLASVQFYPQVNAEETGSPIFGMMKFKGQVTPAKIDIAFPGNEVVNGMKVYIIKDGFGEIKCFDGR